MPAPLPYAGPSLTNPEKRYDPWDNAFATGEGELRRRASDIEGEEYGRYQGGLGVLQSAYAKAQGALDNTDLLFSKAADAIGARSGMALNALRQSLGARGLNPNSGAASGMLARLMADRENSVMGAMRDTAIARQQAAAQNFQNALNLAVYQNAPVSSVGLDTETNIFEGLLARRGIESAQKSEKRAAKNSLYGGLIGGGANLLSGLLGAA